MSKQKAGASPECCTPIPGEAVSEQQAVELARVFKALGDPVRLRLLSLISTVEGGEACVCDLTEPFEVSAPTISHHLKVLREAGLIEGERRGTWVYYRPVPEVMTCLSVFLAPNRLDHAAVHTARL